jgi:hypothetical protein
LKLLSEIRDRSVCTPKPLQNAASGGVRKRGERGIDASPLILNNTVKYIARLGRIQGEAERALRRPAALPRAESIILHRDRGSEGFQLVA